MFDATNSTNARRAKIIAFCQGAAVPIRVVFVESICNDPAVLENNLRDKVMRSPDYAGTCPETAAADFRARVREYEAVYEELQDDSVPYIKLFNLQVL